MRNVGEIVFDISQNPHKSELFGELRKTINLEFLHEIASKVPKEHRALMYNKKVSDWDSVWTFLMNEGKELE